MADDLGRLRQRLESLRVEYERFFLGLEKRPPLALRAQVSREIRRYQPQSNAVDKFKHRNLIQRLVTLEQYWERTQRAIDSGTFARDLARADYRQSRRQSARQQSSDERRRSGIEVGSLTDSQKKETERRATAVSSAATDFLKELNGLSGQANTIGMRGTSRRTPKK